MPEKEPSSGTPAAVAAEEAKQEIATLPVAATPMDVATDAGIEAMEKHAVRMAQAYDTLRKAALSVTSLADWEDLGGNPYLNEYGCAKVMPLYRIDTGRPTWNKTYRKDEFGDIMDVECEIEFSMPTMGNRHMTITGTSSTRDSFFGIRKNAKGEKVYLPISEIPILNVIKKAETNCLNRGLKKLVGLSFTWEEISAITGGRITQEKIVAAGKGVKYGSGTQGGRGKDADPAASADKRDSTWKLILEMNQGNASEAKKAMIEMTAFKGKDGNMVPGKSEIMALSDIALNILADKVKRAYAEFKKPKEEK
jgi:hypothetical protein